jgi:hypothetical protein
MLNIILDKFLFKILPQKIFELGKGVVIRYTLIEIKWLFSIYFHQIKTFEQDRFHTHAFNAHVFIIRGGYCDKIKDGIGPNKPTKTVQFKAGDYRYIPRLLNHKLLEAKENTVSVLITGSYSNIWTEETDEGVLRILTKGRKPLIEIKM